MSNAASPLRYPGGKGSLLDFTANILKLNGLSKCQYAEPFAGGCGLALGLLFEGHVSEIHINDIDLSIWAFWKSVVDYTDELIELIENTPVTVEEWYRQREIHRAQNRKNILSLGFSTFFLNRTNRSGIIKGAGVIGGFAQTGNYKIDCRYNIAELSKKIQRISKYRDSIHLYNWDAIKFINSSVRLLDQKSFMFIDPPYFNKGAALYTSFYTGKDHAKLASAVMAVDRPWVVTYDLADEIQFIYKNRRQFMFDLQYSVQTKRLGTELLVASKGLRLPPQLKLSTNAKTLEKV